VPLEIFPGINRGKSIAAIEAKFKTRKKYTATGNENIWRKNLLSRLALASAES
jgi:hypothetical protein